jgi:hypothetical protein
MPFVHITANGGQVFLQKTAIFQKGFAEVAAGVEGRTDKTLHHPLFVLIQHRKILGSKGGMQ